MAIFDSAAFTRLKKSFGNLTTYRSRGQNIVRIKVTDVRNPRTLAQQTQRARMGFLFGLCDVFNEAIVVGFPRRPLFETSYNTFVRTNVPEVEVNEEMVATMDYSRLVCAKGNLVLPTVTVTLDTENNVLVFAHKVGEFGKHSEPTDQLYAALYEKKQNKMKLFALNTRKDTESVSVTLPSGWTATDCVVYVFALSATKQNASNSVCVQPE